MATSKRIDILTVCGVGSGSSLILRMYVEDVLEEFGCAVLGPVATVAKVAKPIVKLLSWSTNFVLWVMRIRASHERNVTEEDIRVCLSYTIEQDNEGTRD